MHREGMTPKRILVSLGCSVSVKPDVSSGRDGFFNRVMVLPDVLVYRDPDLAIFKAAPQTKGQFLFDRAGEQQSFNPVSAISSLGVFNRFFSHPGLIHTDSERLVCRNQTVKLIVLGRKGGPFEPHHLA
jgi:hypothetical protein